MVAGPAVSETGVIAVNVVGGAAWQRRLLLTLRTAFPERHVARVRPPKEAGIDVSRHALLFVASGEIDVAELERKLRNRMIVRKEDVRPWLREFASPCENET